MVALGFTPMGQFGEAGEGLSMMGQDAKKAAGAFPGKAKEKMDVLRKFAPKQFAKEIELGEAPWPAHHFLGALPLSTGVYLICAFHTAIALMAIGTCSSVTEISFAGVRVAPGLQVAISAWYCVGLGLIACGVLGMYYGLVPHLRLYFWYSLLNCLLQLVPFAQFIVFGTVCTTHLMRSGRRDPHARSDLGSNAACSIADNFLFVWMLCISTLSAYAAYIVWSAKEWAQLEETHALKNLMKKSREAYQKAPRKTGVFHPDPGHDLSKGTAAQAYLNPSAAAFGFGGRDNVRGVGVRSGGAVETAQAARASQAPKAQQAVL